MSAPPVLGPDAAIVLGMGSTAVPFARSAEAEAERWLRVMRLHGDVGRTLQALGVSEAPLEGSEHHVQDAGPHERDAVAAVTEHAVRVARERRAKEIDTRDVFVAVMQVYGSDFEHVLRAHGTDGREVLGRLGVTRAR
jgi:hypothetical protein